MSEGGNIQRKDSPDVSDNKAILRGDLKVLSCIHNYVEYRMEIFNAYPAGIVPGASGADVESKELLHF